MWLFSNISTCQNGDTMLTWLKQIAAIDFLTAEKLNLLTNSVVCMDQWRTFCYTMKMPYLTHAEQPVPLSNS